MHDRVELNHISYDSSQSGQGGGRNTSTRELHRNHGGGGAGLRDEPTASDDSSTKAHTITRGESSLLKIDLIIGSHEMSNSSVMTTTPFRTLEEPVHRVGYSLTTSGRLVNITSISTANCCNTLYMDMQKICSYHCNLLTV